MIPVTWFEFNAAVGALGNIVYQFRFGSGGRASEMFELVFTYEEAEELAGKGSDE